MKPSETSARKFDYRRWKTPIVVASVVIVGMLLTLLVIVPSVFGDRFVSYSSRLAYSRDPYVHPYMEVVYVNGSLIKVSHIGVVVNWNNSYFMPVQVRYNGFDYVMLVYNSTVNDPADIATNKEFLVWGAFYGSHLPFSLKATELDNKTQPNLGNHSGYDYYVTHKDLSNYTKTIPVGTSRAHLFYTWAWPWWSGEDLRGNGISPGIYYIYIIAYGKTLEPMSLNVTSVWTSVDWDEK